MVTIFPPQSFREGYELGVNVLELGEIIVHDPDGEEGLFLQSVQDIEAAAAAGPLHRVLVVGDVLYLVEDELGDDKGPLYETGLAYVCYPPVYDGARVEKLDVLVLFQAIEERDLGEVDRFRLLFPEDKPEVTHDEVEKDVDGARDGDVLDQGEKETGHEEIGHEKAHDNPRETSENDLQGYVPELELDLEDGIPEDQPACRPDEPPDPAREEFFEYEISGKGCDGQEDYLNEYIQGLNPCGDWRYFLFDCCYSPGRSLRSPARLQALRCRETWKVPS